MQGVPYVKTIQRVYSTISLPIPNPSQPQHKKGPLWRPKDNKAANNSVNNAKDTDLVPLSPGP